jgi:hypothetical protein
MLKNFVVLVLVVGAIVAIVVTVVNQTKKARSHINIKETFEEGQVCQEIYCDNCRETSTGLSIKRAFAQQYQDCPACGQKKGRPIVYYYCQDPECDKALIRIKNVVVEEGRVLAGDRGVCPICGREDMITPMELDLSSVRKIAQDTDQDFP